MNTTSTKHAGVLLQGPDLQWHPAGTVLGGGGFGTVVEVPGLRDVCVKVFHPPEGGVNDPQAVSLREAHLRRLIEVGRALPRSSHNRFAWPEGICRAKKGVQGTPIEYWVECIAVTMPKVPGTSLAQVCDNMSSQLLLSPRSILRLAAEVCMALADLHGVRLVHGDLKLDNVMCSSLNTSSPTIRLVDVDSFSNNTTIPANCGGTPAWHSPERSGGGPPFTPTQADDLHALALIVFNVLVRSHPSRGTRYKGDPLTPEDARVCNRHTIFTGHVEADAETRLWMQSLSPALLELFLRAFCEGLARPEARPQALEWLNQFKQEEAHLKACCACGVEAVHSPAGKCPWCAMSFHPFPRLVRLPQPAGPVAVAPVAATPVAQANPPAVDTWLGRIWPYFATGASLAIIMLVFGTEPTVKGTDHAVPSAFNSDYAATLPQIDEHGAIEFVIDSPFPHEQLQLKVLDGSSLCQTTRTPRGFIARAVPAPTQAILTISSGDVVINSDIPSGHSVFRLVQTKAQVEGITSPTGRSCTFFTGDWVLVPE